MAAHPTLQVLAIPAVRHFALARLCRAAAATGLAAAVGWHVYDVTGSALALGLLGIVEFVPVVPIGLWGGALADTRDRVALTRWAQLAIAAAVGGLAITHALDLPIAWVFAAAFLLACGQAIERPANSAILPSLVPPEQFGVAITVVSAVRNVALALGPVVAGFTIASAGITAAYVLAAVLVLASALALTRLPPALPQPRDDGEESAVTLTAVAEGISFVRSNRPILGSMTLDLFAVIFASVDALLPVFARDVLGVGAEGFGVLSGALAFGTFAMSAVMWVRPPGERPGRALIWAVAAFGAATLVFAASSSFALSVAALVVAGMADQVSMVARETILQLSTPDALRGRVSAVNFVFIGASNELGRAESGALAAWIGAVASVWWGGGLCLTALGAVATGIPELASFVVSRPPSPPVRGSVAP